MSIQVSTVSRPVTCRPVTCTCPCTCTCVSNWLTLVLVTGSLGITPWCVWTALPFRLYASSGPCVFVYIPVTPGSGTIASPDTWFGHFTLPRRALPPPNLRTAHVAYRLMYRCESCILTAPDADVSTRYSTLCICERSWAYLVAAFLRCLPVCSLAPATISAKKFFSYVSRHVRACGIN